MRASAARAALAHPIDVAVADEIGGVGVVVDAFFAAAQDDPEARVAQAMRDFPEYVGGTRRDVTTLMRRVPGLVAKDGAEAVYAVGLADGRGIAVKIADGGSRARAVVVAAVLRRLGIEDDEVLAALEHQPVLGHGHPVGAVVAVEI